MGNLYIVATPIGNLGDISKRAIETLNKVDLILCEDTRTSSHLLNFYEIKTKLMSYHKFNEEKRSEQMITFLKEGKDVALISDAGTPCISDPGSILVRDAIKNEIEVFSIPGSSALLTALTLSGLTLNNFAFYGFLERRNSFQKKELLQIKNNDLETIVIYESPKRIKETLQNILEVLDNPYIIVLNDLTKKFEKKYYGLTKDVITELTSNPSSELGEYVIVISKNKKIKKEEKNNLSLEALLIDKVFKEKCSMKEAINKLALETKNIYSKKEIYAASLNIKNFFEK